MDGRGRRLSAECGITESLGCPWSFCTFGLAYELAPGHQPSVQGAAQPSPVFLRRAGTTPWQLCGMDGLVLKPLTAMQLHTALERVYDHSAVPSAATAACTSAAGPAAGGGAACSSDCHAAVVMAADEAAPGTDAALPHDAAQISGCSFGSELTSHGKPAVSAAIATIKRELKRRGSPLRRTSSNVSASSYVALPCEARDVSSPGL